MMRVEITLLFVAFVERGSIGIHRKMSTRPTPSAAEVDQQNEIRFIQSLYRPVTHKPKLVVHHDPNPSDFVAVRIGGVRSVDLNPTQSTHASRRPFQARTMSAQIILDNLTPEYEAIKTLLGKENGGWVRVGTSMFVRNGNGVLVTDARGKNFSVYPILESKWADVPGFAAGIEQKK